MGDATTPVPVVLPSEPWWSRAITRWGAGTAIGIYLVWLLGSQVVARLDAMDLHLQQHMASQDTMKELLAAVCANTAKTNEERTFCYDITMRADRMASEVANATKGKNGGRP